MLPARLLLSLASSVISEHIPSLQDASHHGVRSLFSGSSLNSDTSTNAGASVHYFAKREVEKGSAEFVVFACLIPVLVILSGVFAGLTLGYMSLDETQLNVLSLSGTPEQREYANKIKPIRKNGHLLLVTLLLANMITNETLPVISDPILGGGVQAVVVSTVLIVLFAEIIPQSVCTRHGLYVGAKCAGIVRVLIWVFGIVAWPVAKLLELSLGPHHGIMYRRAELKELIAMHGAENLQGGDLRHDTVTIIGATLDLQDKTVRHAMTPIDRVFMLHIDAKLDYDTLRRICATGHSRIPVYEEVELTVPVHVAISASETGSGDGSLVPATAKKSIDGESLVKTKVKRIMGVLLVKHCVLLDPEDAVPVRKMRLIKVPFVPQNEPLLGVLDRFQDGRSHMAIVSRLSVERAQSVKKEVKKGVTQRFLGAFHADSSASDASDSSDDDDGNSHASASGSDARDRSTNGDSATIAGEDSTKESTKVKFTKRHGFRKRDKKSKHQRRGNGDVDLEKGDAETEAERVKEQERKKEKTRKSGLEQRMPADAVLSKKNADEYLASQGIDPAIMPLGIITLEDVLEELIGEEIYDEFDIEGSGAHTQSFLPPGAHPHQQQTKPGLVRKHSAPELAHGDKHGETPPMSPPVPGRSSLGLPSLAVPKPIQLTSLKSLGFLRSRSAPPTPHEPVKQTPASPATSPSGASTPVPAISGTGSEGQAPKMPRTSLESERNAGGTHPSISTSPAEREGQQLAQIVESPDNSEGGSPPYIGPVLAGAETVMDKHQSEGQTKTPSPPAYLFPNPSIAVASAMPKSRSASPAPSLEAILHSKRRVSTAACRTGEGSQTSGGSGVHGEQRGRVKGTFKSSPLAPLGADANILVADEIRREKEREREKEKERREQETKGKDATEKGKETAEGGARDEEVKINNGE